MTTFCFFKQGELDDDNEQPEDEVEEVDGVEEFAVVDVSTEASKKFISYIHKTEL